MVRFAEETGQAINSHFAIPFSSPFVSLGWDGRLLLDCHDIWGQHCKGWEAMNVFFKINAANSNITIILLSGVIDVVWWNVYVREINKRFI